MCPIIAFAFFFFFSGFILIDDDQHIRKCMFVDSSRYSLSHSKEKKRRLDHTHTKLAP